MGMEWVLPAKVDGAIVEETWRSMVTDLIWSDGPRSGFSKPVGSRPPA